MSGGNNQRMMERFYLYFISEHLPIIPSLTASLVSSAIFQGTKNKEFEQLTTIDKSAAAWTKQPWPGVLEMERWRAATLIMMMLWSLVTQSPVATGQCPGDRGNDRYRLLLLLFVKCSSSSSGQDSGGRSPCFDTDHDVTMIARCDVFL